MYVVIEAYKLQFLGILITTYALVLSLHIKSINLMICSKEVHLMYAHISNSFSIKASTHGAQKKQK